MNSPRWLSDEEQAAWRAYLDATRLLMNTLDHQLVRDAQLSLTDFSLLVALSEAPGRQLRMSGVADAVATSRSTVTRAMNRLVDKGWVERIPCVDDRRGAWAHLTPAGLAKLVDAAPAHVDEVRETMIDVLSPAELNVLATSFQKIRDRLS
ncbi:MULTISPECIES: MarR family winged helix-turn-helix transcriptional regulator [Gordonia]|uniref:MarR family transcriptional regulator n=2 Tax=Gordonia TaxID=2053 RepID=A0ABN3HLQ7_9ACTN|nr:MULTISPECIES: MarR family transcriptional regulator [Gordonia]AUH68961.1 MarR family transcriptional regulator [Gordonia sp. YC-JH1]KJR07627.1 MarR family transcriptional regulator [Gordonia sihwensis]KXT56425.1 MarR family transcriptional regulator [Gordonia sp. QH-12]MBY4570730.1 MarR family transcriptional regulator [Gordonia sihwensis]WFN94820.1 MarR family transcriptional regulator [Gordonia sihwensis]